MGPSVLNVKIKGCQEGLSAQNGEKSKGAKGAERAKTEKTPRRAEIEDSLNKETRH